MLSQTTSNKKTKIVIMRHVNTTWNAPHRIRVQGQSTDPDITYSERGKKEVLEKLSSTEKPNVLLVSPLRRCKQTAEIWLNTEFDKIDCEKKEYDTLKEINSGLLEGMYVDEIEKSDYKEIWNAWKNDTNNFTGFPKGETLKDFQKRTLGAFSEICQTYGNESEKVIYVITHGGPIRILKCFLANQDLSYLWKGKEVSNLDQIELTSDQIAKLQNYHSSEKNEVKTVTTQTLSESKSLTSNTSSSTKTNNNAFQFFKHTYSPTHWAMHLPNLKDNNFIAKLKIDGSYFILMLNATDARDYRGIARLVTEKEEDITTTFNRQYTIDETLALFTALTIFSQAYQNLGLVCQISIAGNNSQSTDKNGFTQIGNEDEPSLLHGHTIGRGDPKTAFIGNVTLKGPKNGLEFNLRGNGKEEGNKKKETWNQDDLVLVATTFANEIQKILATSKKLSHVEVISIRKENKKLEKFKL